MEETPAPGVRIELLRWKQATGKTTAQKASDEQELREQCGVCALWTMNIER